MNIQIDYREKDIITLFQEKENVNFNVSNLIIGDFVITKNEEVLFLIERKSIKDLCASIIDGRWVEQKNRLIESINDPSKIVYIIEGEKEKSQGIPLSTINSSILNLIFKHKYKVIFTNSKKDTVDNIIMLYTKIKDNKLELNTDIKTMKIIKKSDKINDNIFINMLCVIPGISSKIAIKIHEKYNSFNDLVIAYSLLENDELKKKMLININITTARKIGKAISEKVYNSICTCNKINEKNDECLI